MVITAFSVLTDIIDEEIAQRFSMVSDLGKVLDAVADKLTQAAPLVCRASRYPWVWLLLALFVI